MEWMTMSGFQTKILQGVRFGSFSSSNDIYYVGGNLLKIKAHDMDNVDKFLALFSEFDMVVIPKKRTTEPNETKGFNVTADQAGQATSSLKKELKR